MNLLGQEYDYGDVVVLPGGKIEALVPTTAGSHDEMGVARFTAGGAPDTTFGGGDGKLAIDFGTSFDPYAALALPSGKVLVSGELVTTPGDSRFLVARLKQNGALDPAFGGGDGFVTTQFGPRSDGAWRIAVDTKGRIVVDGWAGENLDGYDLAVARYTPSGAPDRTFSGDGKVLVQFFEGHDDYAYGLGLQGDKIVAGVHLGADTDQIGLARFLPNGRLDQAFGGGDGEVITPGGTNGLSLQDIAVDASGRILALAQSASQFEVVRYLPGGKLDKGFGTGGFGAATTFAGSGSPQSMAIGGNGKIVAVGEGGTDAAIARWVA